MSSLSLYGIMEKQIAQEMIPQECLGILSHRQNIQHCPFLSNAKVHSIVF